jgi:UrcA family protein
MSRYHAAIAALFLAMTPLAANAQASAQNLSQNYPQTRSITVYAGDLNLASAAGRATLEARIGNAVGTVCGFPHSAREAAAYAACSRDARASAETEAASLAAAAGKVAGGQKDPRTVR